jgi:hypothetical protein
MNQHSRTEIEETLASEYENVEVASVSPHGNGRLSARVWITETHEESDR